MQSELAQTDNPDLFHKVAVISLIMPVDIAI
jgi:hypothetical protein